MTNWASELMAIFGSHQPKLFVVAGFGAALLYSRWGKDAASVYIPRDVIRTLHLRADRNTQLEFVVFVVVGSIVAVIAANPASTRQAFAAGLGWSGLFTVPKSQPKGEASDDPQPSQI